MNNDRLLFVSLYLVILIFFVTLNIISLNPKLKEQLIPLINPSRHLISDIQPEDPALFAYYSDLKAYLPSEMSIKSLESSTIFSKDFSWDDVFIDSDLTPSFQDFLELYNKYDYEKFKSQIEIDVLNDAKDLKNFSQQYSALLNFTARQPKALMFKINLVHITQQIPYIRVKLISH